MEHFHFQNEASLAVDTFARRRHLFLKSISLLALQSLATSKSGFSQLIRSSKSSGKLDGCRCLSSIACRTTTHQIQPSGSRTGFPHFVGGMSNNDNNVVQSWQFLGCGDGGEGVLYKTYEERRILGMVAWTNDTEDSNMHLLKDYSDEMAASLLSKKIVKKRVKVAAFIELKEPLS